MSCACGGVDKSTLFLLFVQFQEKLQKLIIHVYHFLIYARIGIVDTLSEEAMREKKYLKAH